MADNDTVSFLKKHGLERLTEIFVREELKISDFQFLRDHPEELQQLLPKLRDRIDFLKAVVDNTSRAVQVDLEPPIICRETLQEICSKYDTGRIFLGTYKVENGKKMYPPESRNSLKKAMVEHFYRLTKGHITHNHFMEMVQTIVNELPDEDPRTWYIPSFQKRSAGGLLQNRYRYMQQTDKRFKRASDSSFDRAGQSETLKDVSPWETMTSSDKAICEGAKSKLKTLGYSDSVGITQSWRASYPIRRFEALKGTITFADWDVLAHYENVHDLINFDFRTVHEESHDCMSLRIPAFVKKFRAIFEGHRNFIDEDKLLEDAIIATFDDNVQVNDQSVFLGLFALPLILRQQFAIHKNKRMGISIAACRAAFISLLETEALILETVEQRRRDANQRKMTVQPFIIVVGTVRHPRAFFVILDNLIIRSNSMIAAADLHFKIHTVFHVEYSKECEGVMHFMQHFFYNLTYDGEREDISSITLLTDFKRL